MIGDTTILELLASDRTDLRPDCLFGLILGGDEVAIDLAEIVQQ